MDWFEASRRAEKVVAKVILKPREHLLAKYYEPENPRTHKRYKGLKSYEVWLGKRLIGYVEHTEVNVARKVGRLRMGNKYVRRWCHHGAGFEGMKIRSSEEYTRKSAVENLITHYIRDGLIRVPKS